MPQFKITQSTKPWNKLVAWLFQRARDMANDSERLGITTVEVFAEELKGELIRRALEFGSNAALLTAARIDIHTWNSGGENNRQYCGICAANKRYEGTPFTITLAEPEKQAST